MTRREQLLLPPSPRSRWYTNNRNIITHADYVEMYPVGMMSTYSEKYYNSEDSDFTFLVVDSYASRAIDRANDLFISTELPLRLSTTNFYVHNKMLFRHTNSEFVIVAALGMDHGIALGEYVSRTRNGETLAKLYINSEELSPTDVLAERIINSFSEKVINEYLDLGIDVVYTRDFTYRMFIPPLELPQFDTFDDRLRFYDSVYKYVNLDNQDQHEEQQNSRTQLGEGDQEVPSREDSTVDELGAYIEAFQQVEG